MSHKETYHNHMTTQDDWLTKVRHLIIDMDGVLYRGNQAIPGVDSFIRFLRTGQISFVLATNNSTQTPEQYVEKLAGMQINVCPAEVLTSALATAAYLEEIAPCGTRVFVVGQDGLKTALLDKGFTLVEDDAEYVVVGMDFQVCYERLAQAALLVRAGAQFIGTNPDRTFPSERGIVPGAGSLLAFLETATDASPIIIGKPAPAMMEQALSIMGAEPATCAMLGDRLETDILAGRHAGLHTILVLSGVTDREMAARADPQPDAVFDDVAHLHRAWREMLDA
jgi:4-nitrophenyl phosphatase